MKTHMAWHRSLAPVLLNTLCLMMTALGQSGYRRPPESVVKMLETPPTPSVVVDPTKTSLLLVERASLPPIEDYAQPMLRLAGRRINPRTNASFGPRRFVGLRLKSLRDGKEKRVTTPKDGALGMPIWSPDGRRFAFAVTQADGVELWIGSTADGKSRRLAEGHLNPLGGEPIRWMPDGTSLLCRFVPGDRGKTPVRPLVPDGPATLETTGEVAAVRTYQDLLKSPHDEALFEHFMTSRLAIIDSTNGKRRDLTKNAMWTSALPSPDGRFLLTTRMVRPFSYLVTSRSFPEVVELRDAKGMVSRVVAERPLRDAIPLGGVADGPRGWSWHATAPATLVWIEALDGGDPKRRAAHRDRIVSWPAPFDGSPREVVKIEHRYRGHVPIESSKLALLNEFDRDRRWTRSWLLDFDDATKTPRIFEDRSSQDRYADGGLPVMKLTAAGYRVIVKEKDHIFLTGAGAGPDGDRPFLDRRSLSTLKTKRLWRCADHSYETAVEILDASVPRLLTRHESLVDAPNYFVRDLARDSRAKITDFVDPTPELRRVEKRFVRYLRKDGVELTATLYLPAGRKPNERLPLVVWAYPREYTNAKIAGQVRGSPYRFTRIGGTSQLFFLTQGYAVMDATAMPVVGSAEKANDTFIEQLVMSAEAAIDHAVNLGVADRDRVGIGGHSYGAFMTANLLAHSDLFKAGIARSGAYNRTLTPFGFQNERRTFWEAPEIYFRMSPFMHAPKIDEPILMIHGERDNNSGTFPIQSKRLYHAIKGHGGRARLVMLPFESHGYRAKESVYHVLAEMFDWFDRHMKAPTSH